MNWISKTQTFSREVWSELNKVSFPSRKEVISTTVVVLITSVVFSVFLKIADIIIVKGYSLIVETLGT